MEWKTIDSAPKTFAFDKILVGTFPKGWVAVVSWPLNSDGKQHFTTMSGDFWPPTHWMHVPQPPHINNGGTDN